MSTKHTSCKSSRKRALRAYETPCRPTSGNSKRTSYCSTHRTAHGTSSLNYGSFPAILFISIDNFGSSSTPDKIVSPVVL